MESAWRLSPRSRALRPATCDRVAVLYGGIVAEQADVFSLFDHPQHPYTKALLQSMPRMGDDTPFLPIPGSAIQIFGDLRACPFAERCARVTAECRVALPEERAIGPGTYRCFHPLEVAA